jgi:hypothetical protein
MAEWTSSLRFQTGAGIFPISPTPDQLRHEANQGWRVTVTTPLYVIMPPRASLFCTANSSWRPSTRVFVLSSPSRPLCSRGKPWRSNWFNPRSTLGCGIIDTQGHPSFSGDLGTITGRPAAGATHFAALHGQWREGGGGDYALRNCPLPSRNQFSLQWYPYRIFGCARRLVHVFLCVVLHLYFHSVVARSV